jgi:rRNA maturation protein Nop10
MDKYEVIVCSECGKLIGTRIPAGFMMENIIFPSTSQFNNCTIEAKCLNCGHHTYITLYGKVISSPTGES